MENRYLQTSSGAEGSNMGLSATSAGGSRRYYSGQKFALACIIH